MLLHYFQITTFSSSWNIVLMKCGFLCFFQQNTCVPLCNKRCCFFVGIILGGVYLSCMQLESRTSQKIRGGGSGKEAPAVKEGGGGGGFGGGGSGCGGGGGGR